MIKNGDIVRVNVKLTAVAVGHDVKCLYKRPDGSTRPVYIPAECMEVVASEAEEKKAKAEYDKSWDDYQTHVDLATGHARPEREGMIVNITEAKPEYKCTVCGKTCKAAIGLSGHMRSHKS